MADISTTAGYAAYTAAKTAAVADPKDKAKKTAMIDAFKTCLDQMGDEAKHVKEMMECCD